MQKYHYKKLCEAKSPILLSFLFNLLSGNGNIEKREKREEKSEEYKKIFLRFWQRGSNPYIHIIILKE